LLKYFKDVIFVEPKFGIKVMMNIIDRQSVCLGKTQPGYLMDTCLSGQDHDKALLAKFDIKGSIQRT
jgi:hypothetical protein